MTWGAALIYMFLCFTYESNNQAETSVKLRYLLTGPNQASFNALGAIVSDSKSNRILSGSIGVSS